MNRKSPYLALLALLFAGGILFAQFTGGLGGLGGGGGGGGGYSGGRGGRGGGGAPRRGGPLIDQGLTAELPADRNGTPTWEIDPRFKKDLFTFARLQYRSWHYTDSWLTDFPDSDLNFTFRLHQMTSLKVDPIPKQVKITDPTLFDYPFVYMLEVGTLTFDDEEAAILRRYLLNGGFLMVDDFWGEAAWANLRDEMKKVFPDRDSEDLDISHPIFHYVFDLKEKPQIPGIDAARRNRGTSITWETTDSRDVHYRAFYDDKHRMVAMICQNTDLGDGWEREGAEKWYFEEFSEKKAYPMGINIVTWAMTH